MEVAPLPVVVLGLAPREDDAEPWAQGTGSRLRLADLAEVAAHELGDWLALDNLHSRPGPTRAELRAAAQAYAFREGFAYALAGSEVVRALGRRALVRASGAESWYAQRTPPLLAWYETDEGVAMAVFPHPSGRNRWYNDARRRVAASLFVRRCMLRGAGERFLATARAA